MIENFQDDLKPNFISDKKIFLKLLSSPREVFSFLNSYKYDKNVNLLLILAGITSTFNRASTKNMGDNLPLWGVIITCIIVGIIFGWITYYIYAALINWTGKWLKGQGTTNAILRVLSYAVIPSITSMVLLIPQMVIYGNDMFRSDGDISSGGIASNILFYTSLLLEFGLSIWSVILCVIAISEVQKLSIAKAVLNLALPAIVIMTPIFLLILIIYGLS